MRFLALLCEVAGLWRLGYGVVVAHSLTWRRGVVRRFKINQIRLYCGVSCWRLSYVVRTSGDDE